MKFWGIYETRQIFIKGNFDWDLSIKIEERDGDFHLNNEEVLRENTFFVLIRASDWIVGVWSITGVPQMIIWMSDNRGLLVC